MSKEAETANRHVNIDWLQGGDDLGEFEDFEFHTDR